MIKRRKSAMKAKRNVISIALLAALLLVPLLLSLPGIAAPPSSSCQSACAMTALAAARSCGTNVDCLKAVLADFKACVATCSR